MRVPAAYDVGVATHTGRVRSANEDDFLLVAPETAGCRLLAAIADGMGGVAGGAEASRAGLHGFASGFLAGAGPDADLEAAVRNGFAAACVRVHEQARLVPALREMGTTLTVAAFGPGDLVVGHVGDTRAYRLRGGDLQQLTTDHASREHKNRLLRCIGGGQESEEPDVVRQDARPGDRFLLCSDGVWSTVPAPRIAEVLGRLPPQAAARRLVELANAAGGPDNATAVVVQFTGGHGAVRDVPLPAEESSRLGEPWRRQGRVGAPRWPWFLLGATLLLAAAIAGRWFAGFDLFAWLRGRL